MLVRNDRVYDDGMVGLSLSGPVRVETVVSQGCRPVVRAMVITKSHDNVIEQLGGKPSMQALRELLSEIGDHKKRLMAHGLLMGRAISEYREKFGRGDFLVRNLIGVDEQSGAVALTDYVKTG